MRSDEPTQAASVSFVGRESELAALRSILGEALAGSGRLALLAGEPGIGKTRTAEELAKHARLLGADVLWGPCHEGEGAPAYWPWVQVIRALARERGDEFAALVGAGADDVSQLVPELGDGRPVETGSTYLAPEQARFRLFDSLATVLNNGAARRPIVIILDDLHWADRPSLAFLRFVVKEIRASPLLILGIYRHTELGRGHALLETLGELTAGSRTILRGLAEREVGRFIEGALGSAPPVDLVSAVADLTEGNPFFVGEVVRLLASQGGPGETLSSSSHLSIPQGVREVIGRRMDGLSQECNRVLTVASAAGREFNAEVVALAVELTPDEFVGALSEAVDARVILESPRAPGSYQFSHALIRETLYQEIQPTMRARVHRQLGEAMEQAHAGSSDADAPALAHHFFEAALAGGDVEKAIDYATRAGERANSQLGYEEASGHYERAVQALELKEPVDFARRSVLFLALGTSQVRSGDIPRARSTFMRAADDARAAGSADLFAGAALAYGIGFTGPEGPDPSGKVEAVLVALLEEALALRPEASDAVRARLLGRLAVALYWDLSAEERRMGLADEAVEMAKRTGDEAAIAATVANRRYVLWASQHPLERIEDAREILRLAQRSGDRERALQAHRWLVTDYMEAGDSASAERAIEAHVRIADELRQPLYQGYSVMLAAMWALMEGRLDDAESLAERARAIGERANNPIALQYHYAQRYLILGTRGDLSVYEEHRKFFRQMSSIATDRPLIHYVLAHDLLKLGEIEQARIEYEGVATKDFADITVEIGLHETFNYAVLVSVGVGDLRRASLLYDLLKPWADRNLIAGSPIISCYGPVAHRLGLLAAAMGRNDDAAAHYEDAMQRSWAMGARPALAETQLDYGRLLLGTGDRSRAIALLDQALATANEIGMRGVADDAAALLRQTERPPTAAPAAAGEALLRKEGEFWTIGFGGSLIRLRDAKGLGYLSILLARPGREFHVAELAGSDNELGDAGELLDPKAKAAYRARLDDLRDDLEEADANGDAGRAAKAREEIEFLAHELARATGLGGRDRKAASALERQRVRVTKALKATLAKIADADAMLGRHLEGAVRTGIYCSYAPAEPVSWNL